VFGFEPVARLHRRASPSHASKAVVYEAKTKPTGLSVRAHIAATEDGSRRKDCAELARLLQRVTGRVPKMWGNSIVGFDQYHYKYASGLE